MNFKKKVTTVFILFLLFFARCYSTENNLQTLRGIELCNKIFDFLDSNNFEPITQDLLVNGHNSFPYNIVINIKSKENSKQNIIFTFFQEDVLQNQKIIKDFVNYVKQQNYKFNTIFLFTYGEREEIKKQGMIYGIDSFLQTINTNDDYTNIIVDLSSSENSIKTSSNGITAPSWLIQNEYNAYLKYKINERIPLFYLSQLYTFSFFHDRMLSSFFNYEVQSIKLNFSKDKLNNELVYSVLKESINSYNNENERLWDQHFLMLNFFGHFKKLTEVNTIKIIIFIVFIWLVIIIMVFFISIGMKRKAWATLKNIWYIAPISFLLIYVTILLGKFCSIAFLNNSTDVRNVFILIGTEFILSFIILSAYYSVTLMFNSNIEEKSIDYLIVITCFLNQSFFIFIDVSLFPIFMAVCILSILALLTKKNWTHIAIFFVMFIPFIPYVTSLNRFADFNKLYNFLLNENLIPLVFSLIFLPFYLIYFRVLTSVKRNSKHNIFLLAGITTAIFSLVVIILCTILSVNIKQREEKQEQIRIYNSYEKIFDFEYKDKIIFDDIIRTINIDFYEQPAQCNVNVSSLKNSPILYTENEIDYITPTTSSFTLPSNPPKHLTFSYGATDDISLVTITAIFPTGKPSEYKSIKKVVTIGK